MTVATPSIDEDGAAQLGVVAGRDQVHAEMGEADHGVGGGQHQGRVALVVEGVGDADGDEEHAGHRQHHRHSQQSLVRLRLVAEPGVGAPSEPHDGERGQTLEHGLGADVVLHQRGHVGDGVDEDEVEQQLERRHPMVVIRRAQVCSEVVEQRGHRVSVPDCSTG